MRRLAAAILFVLAASPAFSQDDLLARARAQAASGHRPEAIAMLRDRVQAEPRDVDARLLLGLVLSWDGQYDDARTELTRVIDQAPAYKDAHAALINIELWSGRPREAKAAADRALALDANDGRFQEGRRRAIDAIAAERPWTAYFGLTIDTFSDDRGAWQEYLATLERATPAGPVLFTGSYANRFGETDGQFAVEAYPRVRPGTYVYLAGSVSSNNTLYPKFRVGGDLYQALPGAFEVSGGYRRLEFDPPVNIYVAALSKYVGDWMFTVRSYYTPDTEGQSSASYHFSGRRYIGTDGRSYIGARYGHGFAREEVRDVTDLAVIDADTVAFESELFIGRDWRAMLNVSLTHQQRPDASAFWQTTYVARLGRRF
jgi:YaiO family outer membrane protein